MIYSPLKTSTVSKFFKETMNEPQRETKQRKTNYIDLSKIKQIMKDSISRRDSQNLCTSQKTRENFLPRVWTIRQIGLQLKLKIHITSPKRLPGYLVTIITVVWKILHRFVLNLVNTCMKSLKFFKSVHSTGFFLQKRYLQKHGKKSTSSALKTQQIKSNRNSKN